MAIAWIEGFLLRPRWPAFLLLGSAAAGVVFCLSVLDLRFLAGTSPYWQAPRGLVPNSWADISTAISGYDFFVRDSWRLPLFQVSKLGAPVGVNIIFTDSIPLVAIFGRLFYRVTDLLVNPYGAWTGLCFIASAMSMTGLVVALGQRSIAATMMAAATGLCMPALLARWGHMSLMAQWQIPLAFIVYVESRASRRPVGLLGTALALSVGALWTHAYLFVMVTGILAATLCQAMIDGRLRLWQGTAIALTWALVLGGLVLLSGYLTASGSTTAEGFGKFSMNVLSPFVPQFSWLFPFMGRGFVDGTGEQYEGFGYLGAGLLLLAIFALPNLRQTLLAVWPRHVCLFVLLVAFAAFALSNHVYAGAWRVASIPLPAQILTMAAMFRSSGRFFWPCLYLFSAFVIVAVPSRWGRAGGWLLVIATVVQVVDTSPLRSALAQRISEPASLPLNVSRWEVAIRQHTLVRVVPPYGCLADPRGVAAQMAVELQLLAARENVATNTVYAARYRSDCTSSPSTAPAPEELRVYLLAARRSDLPADAYGYCAIAPRIAVCSQRLGRSAVAALDSAQR